MPTYTLITVTHGGFVSHAPGFETLRLCQEARSIALCGMTIAEKEEADLTRLAWARQQAENDRASMEASWRRARPARAPTPAQRQDMRRMVLVWKPEDTEAATEVMIDHPWGHFFARPTRSKLGADGMIHEDFMVTRGGGGNVWLRHSHDPAPNSIRYAKCVIELPDEPAVPLSKLTPGEAA